MERSIEAQASGVLVPMVKASYISVYPYIMTSHVRALQLLASGSGQLEEGSLFEEHLSIQASRPYWTILQAPSEAPRREALN